MDEMGLKPPVPRIDIEQIRRKYHAAKREMHNGRPRAK